MSRSTVALLACLAALLATAPAASAATNITIVAGSVDSNNSGAPNFTPTGANSQIGVDNLNTALASGNVTIDTTPDNGQAGTITVDAAINWNTANDLTLDADAAITVNAAISSAGTGDLTLAADDPITQTASIAVPGLTVSTNTADNVTLTNVLNDFNSVTTGAGLVSNFLITDVDGLSLGAISANSGLTVTAGGDVTQAGAAIVSGTMTFDVGPHDVTVNNAANNFSRLRVISADDVEVVRAGALILSDNDISGDLVATASGNITQIAPVEVGGTATLAAGAANDITLNNGGNDFTTVAIASADDVTLVDGSGLTFDASTVSDSLTVNATGALTQSAAITVVGSTNATGQPVTLDQPGNDFGPVLITSTGASPALVVDANDLILDDSTSAGALTAWAADDLTVAGAGTVAATDALRLVADNQNPTAPAIGTGGITVGANAVLTGAGPVRLYAARRGDNAIDPTATFNGSTFTAGPLFVPSAREQWGVYSPGGTAAAPFTFFYKDADTSLPQAAITTPADGATYEQGQVVNAAYSCSDDAGGSGVATCAGTVASGSPIDTATAGQKTFTVEAVDGAGNRRTTSVTYTVAAAPAPPQPPPPGESPTAGVAVEGPAAVRGRGRRTRLDTGIVVTCPAGLPRRCSGSGRVTANVPDAVAARTVVVGKLGFAIRPGESRRVVLRLTPRGARILERVRRLRVTIRVTTRGRGGARVLTSRRVTLRIR